MISQNALYKLGLAAIVLTSASIGLWTADGPTAAVSKSAVSPLKCCSTWEDHMRASGVDDEVGKAFDLKPLFADTLQPVMAHDKRFVIRH
ncbi:hypothetical protein V5T82_01015 [Magnetovibrio sp. PR-2]|uniref:hypothetical protein n=1 Tax=Magnetovibrio sp. PR-2 TaxID=3120356 RepID=UPI002FCE44B8